MGDTTVEIIYYPKSGKRFKKLKALYNQFKEEYLFDMGYSLNRLVVKEREHKDGIKISPEDERGEIKAVLANKFYSELEIKLVKNYPNEGCLFATKEGKWIEISYKNNNPNQ
jgi:hypothetical protein